MKITKMNDQLFFELIEAEANGSLISGMIWTYSIVGFLFMFYAVAIFIQCRIKRSVRMWLSFLFFLIGLLFFNLAGRAITGYVYQFTLLTIISGVVLAFAGMGCVYVLLRINKLKKK